MNISAKDIVKLSLCIALVLGVGATSAWLSSAGTGEWYRTINKPSWNPPNELFGPVWTLLYTLMGIGLFLILRSSDCIAKRNAIGLFAIQLTLNFFWSIIFFRWHFMGLALINIVLLLLTILIMIRQFKFINLPAGLLQIPYAIWVGFATILNLALFLMN